MGMKVSGTLIAHGSAINVDIGFVPDYVEAYYKLGGTEVGIKWYRCLADAATTGQYGIALANGGDISVAADANNGIIAYEGVKTPMVLVESPAPGAGDVYASCLDFTYHKAAATTPTARTATTVGTVIRPTTANGYVYECTTSGGAMTALTEPTWGTSVGGTTSDGSNTWTCREENRVLAGGMGFTIGSTLSTNSDIWVFSAEQHDKYGDMGDADGQDPVKYPLR